MWLMVSSEQAEASWSKTLRATGLCSADSTAMTTRSNLCNNVRGLTWYSSSFYLEFGSNTNHFWTTSIFIVLRFERTYQEGTTELLVSKDVDIGIVIVNN